ncbi:hypothetical protein TSUD_170370 [Trifolium subterraneum]|uniref:Pentacotripeptide-repeat region of PRORP domain-containing protein n=1 Tax=Trifolium subterraneum TaxID=3900 RepID=A0A2Z6LNR1_TRISU|nr:hypothetical protein TSUD_170370 [Trifolium subterraneum]
MTQVSSGVRAFTWFSPRRQLEDNIINLHKCKNLNFIKQIHAQIIKCHLHKDLNIAPKLIASYSLTNRITSAVNVFNQVPNPNVHLYNYLIRAHSLTNNESNSYLAFATFLKMQMDDVLPDNFTYPFLLKGCNGRSWCGDADMAMKLFSAMEERDVVSWNTMVGGLIKCGDFDGALKLFDEMPVRDRVSWNTMLDAFAKAGEMEKAFELFQRMGERDVVSWSTMVYGYSNSGDMDMARILFDRCPMKNLVLWTTIISGYAEKGQVKKATELYDEMEKAGLWPDDAFFISILAACAEDHGGIPDCMLIANSASILHSANAGRRKFVKPKKGNILQRENAQSTAADTDARCEIQTQDTTLASFSYLPELRNSPPHSYFKISSP